MIYLKYFIIFIFNHRLYYILKIIKLYNIIIIYFFIYILNGFKKKI